MLRFPDRLLVRVTAGSSGRPVADVAVHLDVRWHGRYYFGHLLGLTDERGQVEERRPALDAIFRQAQRDFPMDYKVPLADCDAVVGVGVRGGTEFETARQAAAGSSLVLPECRAIWARARNAEVATTTREVDLGASPPDLVVVTLDVAPAT